MCIRDSRLITLVIGNAANRRPRRRHLARRKLRLERNPCCAADSGSSGNGFNQGEGEGLKRIEGQNAWPPSENCCFPPLSGGQTFFCFAKRKLPKKRRPRLRGRLRRLPCATRTAGRLCNSGLRPSNSARRQPPAFLRCSALYMGINNVAAERSGYKKW